MEALNSSMGKLSAHTNFQVESPVVWNATQHTATADQKDQGVVDLPEEAREKLCHLLTFEELPTAEVLRVRSTIIAGFVMAAGAKPGDRVMVGGAPFFMEELSHSLRSVGYQPVFAFSRRESVEKVMPDGSVQKVAVFRHLGFVETKTPQP
jgi:hypothetical protein